MAGVTGPTGPQGGAGTAGAIGATGPVGATGPQGTAGTAGSAGVVGATGPVGVTGPQGTVGGTGTAGAVGATGVTGATGPAGAANAGAIRKTAPQTMTATAQTAVADMAFAVAANSTYYFDMTVLVSTSTGTAPTTAWGFTGPAGATVAITGQQDSSSSVEAKAALTAFGAFAAAAQAANEGAAFQGVIVTGATPGTVQLTCARAGTAPSMVIPLGSNGFWLKTA